MPLLLWHHAAAGTNLIRPYADRDAECFAGLLECTYTAKKQLLLKLSRIYIYCSLLPSLLFASVPSLPGWKLSRCTTITSWYTAIHCAWYRRGTTSPRSVLASSYLPRVRHNCGYGQRTWSVVYRGSFVWFWTAVVHSELERDGASGNVHISQPGARSFSWSRVSAFVLLNVCYTFQPTCHHVTVLEVKNNKAGK